LHPPRCESVQPDERESTGPDDTAGLTICIIGWCYVRHGASELGGAKVGIASSFTIHFRFGNSLQGCFDSLGASVSALGISRNCLYLRIYPDALTNSINIISISQLLNNPVRRSCCVFGQLNGDLMRPALLKTAGYRLYKGKSKCPLVSQIRRRCSPHSPLG